MKMEKAYNEMNDEEKARAEEIERRIRRAENCTYLTDKDVQELTEKYRLQSQITNHIH
jgi:nicotinic acid mononucleotide adenylyltransferase